MANLSELTFTLWNATSLHNKEQELSYFINNNKVDVALITETWFKQQTKLNIVNYEVIRMDSQRSVVGGVAIIINRQIKFHVLPQINIPGSDILLIKIQSNINITVGVIYVPPKAQFTFDSLNEIFNKYAPIIILGGDFNAKHKL